MATSWMMKRETRLQLVFILLVISGKSVILGQRQDLFIGALNEVLAKMLDPENAKEEALLLEEIENEVKVDEDELINDAPQVLGPLSLNRMFLKTPNRIGNVVKTSREERSRLMSKNLTRRLRCLSMPMVKRREICHRKLAFKL